MGNRGATGADLATAMGEVFVQLLDNTRRFPEFGGFQEEGAETWISEGNYQISTLHEPKKVILQRSVDRERRLAFVVRVYQKKISLERLRDIRHHLYRTAVTASR